MREDEHHYPPHLPPHTQCTCARALGRANTRTHTLCRNSTPHAARTHESVRPLLTALPRDSYPRVVRPHMRGHFCDSRRSRRCLFSGVSFKKVSAAVKKVPSSPPPPPLHTHARTRAHTHTHTERHTHRHTDTQTQTDRQTDRHTDRHPHLPASCLVRVGGFPSRAAGAYGRVVCVCVCARACVCACESARARERERARA